MGRIKTFANAGSLLPGDLNSMQDDYEYAFSTYKSLISGLVACGSPSQNNTNGNIYTLPKDGDVTAQQAQGAAFYLDPADLTVGSPNARTNKLRVRVSCLTNAVAPTSTLTVGLYPVATWTGPSNSSKALASVGVVTPGSTVAFAAPAAGGQTVANSGDFTHPVAGWYVLAYKVTTTPVANSITTLLADLQYRQV